MGALLTHDSHPTIQLSPVYGLRNVTDTETFAGADAGLSGTVSTVDESAGAEYKVTTGTSVGGYGIVRSRRLARSREGQGLRYKLSARFDTPVASSTQRIGGVQIGTELSFGYNNTTFGILYRTGGRVEIQRLTINTPAGGAETATITLNGTPTNVSLTAATAATNAAEIAATSFSGWNVYQNGSTVTFVASSLGNKSNTFSFASTGVAAGTFSEVIAGADVTDTWTSQSSWNIDPVDGTGPSGLTLDPTKGNLYMIEQQANGYGNFEYAVPSGYFALCTKNLAEYG
jgi:hypothetical protein